MFVIVVCFCQEYGVEYGQYDRRQIATDIGDFKCWLKLWACIAWVCRWLNWELEISCLPNALLCSQKHLCTGCGNSAPSTLSHSHWTYLRLAAKSTKCTNLFEWNLYFKGLPEINARALILTKKDTVDSLSLITRDALRAATTQMPYSTQQYSVGL